MTTAQVYTLTWSTPSTAYMKMNPQYCCLLLFSQHMHWDVRIVYQLMWPVTLTTCHAWLTHAPGTRSTSHVHFQINRENTCCAFAVSSLLWGVQTRSPVLISVGFLLDPEHLAHYIPCFINLILIDSRCFESSQPLRITSGLKTSFNRPLNYSDIGVFSGTMNVINIKPCMIVLLTDLSLFISLPVILTIFQYHSSVKQFLLILGFLLLLLLLFLSD